MRWINKTAVPLAQTDPAFGAQVVRSYVLDPDKRVVDPQTGVKILDAEAVLDGDIDAFLKARLAG